MRSVYRRHQRNLHTGEQQRTFAFIQAARGRKGGRVSGAKRRAATLDRDAAIVAAYAEGQTQAARLQSSGWGTAACRTRVSTSDNSVLCQQSKRRKAAVVHGSGFSVFWSPLGKEPAEDEG